MKNCNEMVDSLFERKEQYEARRNRNRKYITHTITAVCSLCIITVLSIGLLGNGLNNANSKLPVTDATMSNPIDVTKKPDIAITPPSNNKIVINQISGVTADKQMIALFINDFVKMNKTELNEYYGINVFPQVPADIPEWNDQVYGIYKRDGGTGEVYWDTMVLNYSNDDFTRRVNLEFDKGTMPIRDYVFLSGREEKSVINNVEVMIGLSEGGYYYAEFFYENIGFCVNADGVSQDEFVEIIASLIQ